jgi:two-component system response regulator (stage 0 sporulation protein F)
MGTILVVDDYLSWRELLEAALKLDGHRVKCAENLEAAQSYLAEFLFDLAIFDMRLGDREYGVQGLTLVSLAKSLQPKIKTIILTGFPDTQQKDKALKTYHADLYVEKVQDGQPLDIDYLSFQILQLLD